MKNAGFLLLMICASFSVTAQSTKKTILIGIDGCRPDAMFLASTPNLDNLADQSIFSPDALNEDVTSSGPGWSAILCGVWSDKHLVSNNNFSGNNYQDYPALFKHFDDFDEDLHTVSICHWAPINDHIVQDHADFILNVGSDKEVADQISNYLAVNDPDFIFLHFDDVDHAGHAYGFSLNVPEYLHSIEIVDGLVGQVISAIEDRANSSNEDWLIVVTTDHGGQGFSHGGSSMEERKVFILAHNENIEPEIISKDSTIIIDHPENCLGDSLELRFDGKDDYVMVENAGHFNFGEDRDFTVECRVRTSVPGDFAIVGNKNWHSGFNKGFVFSFKYPSGPEWKVNIGDGDNRVDINTGGSIADNEWHTLSASFDRDGLLKIYEDGHLIDSAVISNIGDISTPEGLFFGTDFNQNYDFSGAIAEVRIWDTVLDGQTIKNWSCTEIDNNHPQINKLLGYWRMNESDTSTTVIDHSEFGNDGIIEGASWSLPDSIIVYDYSNTPRLTDVVPTVLTHHCIPLEDDWGLEGQSLIPACSPTGIGKASNKDHFIYLYPNPANNMLMVSINDEINHGELGIYSLTGEIIIEKKVVTGDIVDVSMLPQGLYYYAFSKENILATGKFHIQ